MSGRLKGGWPAAVIGVAAAAYYALSRLVVVFWSYSPISGYGFPWRGRMEAYARWDGGWYYHIATKGYYYNGPNTQAAVAFFPAYPTAMRIVGTLIDDVMIAGILITIVAAAIAMVLLHRWATDRYSAKTATIVVVLVATTPYAYYFFGVIYSDAMFLATAVAAFLLLERRHPWLAAVAGAFATAERPVGLAVTAGLVLRSLEIDGVLTTRWSLRFLRLDLRRLRISTLAPALSVAGVAAFVALLWLRFDEPFAFAKVSNAPAWGRDFSPSTVLKFEYFELLTSGEVTVQLMTTTVSAVLTVVAIALIPRVWRDLGSGYAVYVTLVVGLPLLTAPQFMGMGRYLLAAFPAYAAAANALAARAGRSSDGTSRRGRMLLVAIPAATSALLVGLAVLFIRGYYLA